jgi:ribosomal protein S18 acetylase RimI-like enzyme
MSSTNNITIRIGELNDVDNLVDLHMILFTAKEHVPVIFGKRYINAIYSWMVKSNETFLLVAELDNSVVGFISSCDSPYTVKMFVACLPTLIYSIFMRPGLLFSDILWKRLMRHFQQRNSEIKMNYKELGISQIMFGGIDPNFRRLGIYSMINSSLTKFCCERGIRAIRSEVYKTNQSIRRYKENDGWIEVPELETKNTVAYMYIIDKKIIQEIDLESLA